MRTLQLLTYIALLGSSVWALPAKEATSGAHFFSTTPSILIPSGKLQVCFDEAGVGNGGSDGLVHYTLTAHVEATWGCINGGSNHPKASNKETFASEAAAAGALDPENGRAVGCLVTDPAPLRPTTFACPNGQTLELIKVEYSNIVLTDTTNNVVANPKPDPISAVVLTF